MIVAMVRTHGRRGGRGAGDTANGPVKNRRQIHREEAPCALIGRLFLHPDELGIRVLGQCRWQRAGGQWVEAFHAHDGDVVQPSLVTLGGKFVVHLAAAQQHASNLRTHMRVVGQQWVEVAGRELLDLGHRLLGAKQ